MQTSHAVLFLFSLFFSMPAQAWCVKTSIAHLRSGPGPKHKISWTVPRHTPLLEVSRKGNWIEVSDQDGEKHWIYGVNVTKKVICGAVKTPTANLRTQPSPNAPLGDIQQADKYTPLERIDIADNGWYKVRTPWGGVYWIHPDLVWRPIRVRGVNL